jgi:hypothetical protein
MSTRFDTCQLYFGKAKAMDGRMDRKCRVSCMIVLPKKKEGEREI